MRAGGKWLNEIVKKLSNKTFNIKHFPRGMHLNLLSRKTKAILSNVLKPKYLIAILKLSEGLVLSQPMMSGNLKTHRGHKMTATILHIDPGHNHL